MSPGHQHAHGHPPHQHAVEDDAGMAELLDLDAEVLHDYLDTVTDWVAAAAGPGVRRIADLGAGTGNGSLALAARFPTAEVTAVGVSEEKLAPPAGRAAGEGEAGPAPPPPGRPAARL